MKPSSLLALCSLPVLLCAPHRSWGEDFLLYTPKAATGDQVPSSPDQGVLVRTVVVKRGDTLKKLSRRHIGVAGWFPQVLLFNTIKNPDLIYPGEKLLVPVRPGRVAAVEKETVVKESRKEAKRKSRHIARRPSHRKASISSTSAGAGAVALDEQEIYQRAKRSYLGGDCQKALDLFDSFLRRFPNSALAADAYLYRADCYLRLSGQ